MDKENETGNVKQRKKVRVIQSPTLEGMEHLLNHYLSRNWVLIELKSEYNEFFQNHIAWIGRRSFVAKVQSFFDGYDQREETRTENRLGKTGNINKKV